jgi:hypothetical protein
MKIIIKAGKEMKRTIGVGTKKRNGVGTVEINGLIIGTIEIIT